MQKQKLYQFTTFILLFVIGIIGSYFFGQQRSLAQTFLGRSLETKTQKFPLPPTKMEFTTAVDPMDPGYFFNMTNWPTSTTPKQDDYMKHVLYFMDLAAPNGTTGTQFADINGDGLLDYLFAYSWNVSYDFGAVLFLNNGNNNFTVAYKCVHSSSIWYGDCAQL